MQYANLMVALGGDAGNTVPKYAVPASEIPILQAIHGAGAIHDVEPCPVPQESVLDEDGVPTGKTRPVKVTNRSELLRLKELYAGPNTTRIVEAVYPGAGAQVVTSLDDLDIPSDLYKAKSRMKPPAPEDDADKTDRERYGATRLPGRNEGGSASRAETDEAEDAGISDMPEQKLTAEPKPSKPAKGSGDILA